MTKETYFEKLFPVSRAGEDDNDEKDGFFQSLYDIIQQKKAETPTYALFFECLIEAYHTPSTWTFEEQQDLFWGKQPLIALPTNEWEELAFFVLAEADYFYKNGYSVCQAMEYGYFADASLRHCPHLLEIFYTVIPDFLAQEENQTLFSLPATWGDFVVLLKKITAYQPLQRLYSRDGRAVLHCFLLHSHWAVAKEDAVGLAWIGSKWQMVYTDRGDMSHYNEETLSYKLRPYDTDFQSVALNWWKYEQGTVDEETRLAIINFVLAQLKHHFSEEEAVGLLQASEIFSCAYPETQGIGNADGVFFDESIAGAWHLYFPYKHHFEAFVGKHQIFDNEWITLAQVLWQHYRWTYDFSAEATAYFLAKAVEFTPALPIQYINLHAYQAGKEKEADAHHVLQSNMGMTYYYYAEFLYYHEKDYAKALAYYAQFVALEPALLPHNLIELDANFASEFVYPPSTQMALAQIAHIYRLQNNREKAKEYIEKAIAIRENNFETPYELLAEMLEEEGNIQEAIFLYEKKINAMQSSIIRQYYGRSSVQYYLVYAPEKETTQYAYFGTYYRAKVVFLHDFYLKIAELYTQNQEPKKAKEATQKAQKIRQSPKHHKHKPVFKNL